MSGRGGYSFDLSCTWSCSKTGAGRHGGRAPCAARRPVCAFPPGGQAYAGETAYWATPLPNDQSIVSFSVRVTSTFRGSVPA